MLFLTFDNQFSGIMYSYFGGWQTIFLTIFSTIFSTKGQGSRSPIIGPVSLVILNIFRLCSFMCDTLFQDKALNKLVLNGQIRWG